MSLAGLFAARRTRARRRETPLRRALRAAGAVVLALIFIPLILTPLYIVLRPASTVMLFNWFTFQSVDRQWVNLDDIAPIVPRTIVTAEDGNFCSHLGVDWGAVSDALDSGDDTPRGASTIPMQTVKNLYLWQGRSYLRKALEVPLAYYADIVLGKRRLLEIYLNVAEWGPGIFGVEAAARHYFNRSAANLDGRQAGLLAAALPNPILRNPGRPDSRLRQRAATLTARAARAAADISCIER